MANRKKHDTAPIGALLRCARKRKKLTANQAAEACEVSRSCYYKWESANYVFPNKFRRISLALGVSITRLRDANRPRVQN